MRSDKIVFFLEDFLWAGSSALLIAVSRLSPSLTPIALIALVPFLWRATVVTCKRAIALGVLLALSYGSVSWAGMMDITAVRQALACLVLFTLFALITNHLTRRVGCNVVLLAAVWLPVEYGLETIGPGGGVFPLTSVDSAVLLRIGSLFGTLAVSFVIVCVNAAVFAIVCRLKVARATRMPAPGPSSLPSCRGHVLDFDQLAPRVFPLLRAPPEQSRRARRRGECSNHQYQEQTSTRSQS